MPDALAIGVAQAGAVGLIVGVAVGVVLGQWLAGRAHRRRAAGRQEHDSAAAPAPPPAVVVANDAAHPVAHPGSSPLPATPVPDPTTGRDRAGASEAADHEPLPAMVLPADVQALIDKGEVFPALSQLRKLSGGMAARRLAREQLASRRVPLPADIRRLADGGNKIGAIQALCEQTHMDLTLARELVERHAAAPR